MRSRVPLFVITVALALPLLAIAATAPAPVGANIAPSTPADAKACILKLFQAQAKATATSGQPAGVTTDGLKDNCTNETITIQGSSKTIMQTGRVGNNDVTMPNGCVANSCSGTSPSTCGTVTLGITLVGMNTTKTISKCDPNYQKDLSSASGNTASAIKNLALQSLAQNAIQGANPSTIAGQTQLSQALQNFGVSAADAQKVVSADAANNTTNAQNLLNAFVSQDQDQISQAATTAGVTLNQDTLNNITSLSPSQVSSNVSSLYTPDQQNSANSIVNSPSTFDTSSANAANTSNLSASLAPMCNQLGGCGNVCPNSNIMVCNTNNPGALTWSAWEAKYGGTPCGQANNTTCFPTMEQGIEAQTRLLTTSNSYFASGNNTIWGEFCGSNYASGPGSNCSAYATFVSQQTGIPVNQTIDPNNAQQIGSIVMAQSRMESGVGVIFTPDQLQTGLGLAYGTQTLPNGTAGYSANTIPTGVGGLGGVIAGGNTSGQIMLSSPFSNVSSLQSNAYQGTNAYTTQGIGSIPVSPVQYVQPTQTSATQYPVNPVTSTNTLTSTNVSAAPAVAQIIATPKTVTHGDPITVVWSSVGMSTFTPCQIFENGISIANGDGGSEVVIATSTGTATFSLSCTALSNGAQVTSAASVSVQ